MMKYIRINRKSFLKYLSFAVFIFVLANCTATIDNITQPTSAKVNDVISVKLNTTFISTLAGADNRQAVLGILAPKGWKLGQSGNTRITLSSLKGNSNMTLIASNVTVPGAKNGENWSTAFKNRLGIGPNYIDDMEWVVFISDVVFTANSNEVLNGTFDIKIKVGADNRNSSVRLGYAICNAGDALKEDGYGGENNYWGQRYADCLSVTGGKGEVIDFCNPALTYLTPTKVLDNEYVTILFDGTITPTKLAGANEVYLCATAHTTDNQDIVVCSQDDKTKMIRVAENKYSITLWPRGYFKVPQGKTLASIDYYITDKAGTTKVGYANTSRAFKLEFSCE